MIHTVLLALAVICFGLAALGVSAGKINLVAAGLCFWALSGLL